jgi:vancomycin resistance protein YoaR
MGRKLSFIFVFVFLFSFLFIFGYAPYGIIPSNVYLEGVHIGGLTIADAHHKVSEHFSRINFTYQNISYSLIPQELGINIDYNGTFRELENTNIWGKVAMNFQKGNLSLRKSFDLNVMEEALAVVNNKVRVSPYDASLEVVDGQIKIWPGRPGKKLAKDILVKNMMCSPLSNEYVIPIIVDNPKISEKDLENQIPDTILAQYTTTFVKNANRTENIKLACAALKNILLPPGEVFSFNHIVGPREAERGYLNAMIILGGQFTPGLGGGVCQVSSTLYNAVLLAELEVVERHSHSLKIDYVPSGRDATVSYGLKDFKFKNNTPGYLLLDNEIVGQNLTISIYGIKEWAEMSSVR